MPTYLGFTSINPLSIYFCYEKPEEPSKSARHPPLKYVILDVQNTFDERHSYLLTVGIDELTPSQSSESVHHTHLTTTEEKSLIMLLPSGHADSSTSG
jgi:DUF1365 family protein